MKLILLTLWFRFSTEKIVEKLKKLDWWLCAHLPKSLRWRWCFLWLRSDENHISYRRDHLYEEWLRRHRPYSEYEEYMERQSNHKSKGHDQEERGDHIFEILAKVQF